MVDRYAPARRATVLVVASALFSLMPSACARRSLGASYPDRAQCNVALQIPSMNCGEVCPGKVRSALLEVEGVEEVEVDFGARTAAVTARWPACGERGYGAMLDGLAAQGYVASIDHAE
jgi:copper chaperone CopZ